MLSENKRVRAKIQSVFEQLVTPHVAKVSYGNVMIVVTSTNRAQMRAVQTFI